LSIYFKGQFTEIGIAVLLLLLTQCHIKKFRKYRQTDAGESVSRKNNKKNIGNTQRPSLQLKVKQVTVKSHNWVYG